MKHDRSSPVPFCYAAEYIAAGIPEETALELISNRDKDKFFLALWKAAKKQNPDIEPKFIADLVCNQITEANKKTQAFWKD